jgi:hypothetical protein
MDAPTGFQGRSPNWNFLLRGALQSGADESSHRPRHAVRRIGSPAQHQPVTGFPVRAASAVIGEL